MNLRFFLLNRKKNLKILKNSVLIFITLYLFHLIWQGSSLYFPTLPTPQHPTHFYSTQVNADLRLTLKRALSKARDSIYISVYSLTDTHLIQTLNKQAEEGISITITCDPNTSGDISHYLHPKILFKRETSTLSLMHRKLLIIDNTTFYIGSANFTYPSLEMHDNLLFGCYHPALAHRLTQEIPSTPLTFEFGKISFLPQHNREALTGIIQRIDNANHSIKIAMFTWTHPDLLEAILRASKRGVKIDVVLDRYTAKGASHKVYKALLNHSIPTYLPPHQELMHHKFLWIDERLLIFGSANWTRAAFSKNEELIFELTNCSSKQQKFLHRVWKSLL